MIALPTLGCVCSPDGLNERLRLGLDSPAGGTISASLSIGANDATCQLSGTSSGAHQRRRLHADRGRRPTCPTSARHDAGVRFAWRTWSRPRSVTSSTSSLEPGKMIPPCGTEDELARPSSTLLGHRGRQHVRRKLRPCGADDFAFYGKASGESNFPPESATASSRTRSWPATPSPAYRRAGVRDEPWRDVLGFLPDRVPDRAGDARQRRRERRRAREHPRRHEIRRAIAGLPN